jgi:quercetin dioxygenase-like cupin family protein
MSRHEITRLPERQPVPGFHGRFVHTDTMTFAYWDIDKDASIPEHSHPHEQVVIPLAGELELVVAGEPHVLSPGSVYAIPGGVPHSARAITFCRVLDVFHPARDDYR